MLILALETSSLVTGVAVAEDGVLLCERTAGRLEGHGARLFPVMRSVLDEAGCGLGDVGCLAVSIGPGSFTAVRMGVAAAKALVMAQPSLVVAAVDSLEALALAACAADGVVCPVLDARKGEVYTAAFRLGEGRPERLSEDVCGPVEQAIAVGGERPVVFGSGARLYADRIASATGGRAVFLPPVADVPRAWYVAWLGRAVLEEEGPTPADRLLPRYVRRPDIRPPRRLRGGSRA